MIQYIMIQITLITFKNKKKHNTDILSKYSFFLSLFSDSAVNNYYSLILFESGCIMDIDK